MEHMQFNPWWVWFLATFAVAAAIWLGIVGTVVIAHTVSLLTSAIRSRFR